MREKQYRTKLPLYGSTLSLIVTDNVPGYYKEHIGDEKPCVAFTAWIKGDLTIIVPNKASLGTLAHEAIHAAGDMLTHHDVRWGSGNQEPLAYLTGWIMDWIQRRIGRVKPG